MNDTLNETFSNITFNQSSQNSINMLNNSNIMEGTAPSNPSINPIINIIVPAFIVVTIGLPIQIIMAFKSKLPELKGTREEKQINHAINILLPLIIFYIFSYFILLIFPTTFSNKQFYFIPGFGLLLIILSLLLYFRPTIELYTRK